MGQIVNRLSNISQVRRGSTSVQKIYKGTSEIWTATRYLYNEAEIGEYVAYSTGGWRVIHKEDGIVYLLSAGCPQTVTSVDSDSAATIVLLNSAAATYVNSYSTAAVPISNTHWVWLTGHTLLESYWYTTGATYGRDNDLCDIGERYWFANSWSTENTYAWSTSRYVSAYYYSNPLGLRPVITLKTGLIVTSGNGTSGNPYQISLS